MSDGLLLTRRERLRGYGGRLALAVAPSLAIALLALATGGAVVAAATAGFGLLVALGVASTVQSPRAALAVGVFLALVFVAFDLWLAYANAHPVLPGD